MNLKNIFLWLDKKSVMIEVKIKILLQIDKEAVLNIYHNNCFPRINFINQELIHHIHFFGYRFYTQSKTNKVC